MAYKRGLVSDGILRGYFLVKIVVNGEGEVGIWGVGAGIHRKIG
jgi:hypothetical protein